MLRLECSLNHTQKLFFVESLSPVIASKGSLPLLSLSSTSVSTFRHANTRPNILIFTPKPRHVFATLSKSITMCLTLDVCTKCRSCQKVIIEKSESVRCLRCVIEGLDFGECGAEVGRDSTRSALCGIWQCGTCRMKEKDKKKAEPKKQDAGGCSVV